MVPISGVESRYKDERRFWEDLRKGGDEVELKYARDLPDDTPEFILKTLISFEDDVTRFCFDEASGRVLDAGCGNGNLLMRSRRGFSGFTYVGLDFSRNMLARAAARSGGMNDAHFYQGCVNKLPFKSEIFDRVVSSGVLTCLSSVEEAREAISEYNRVLKTQGVLVVDFFNKASHFTRLREHVLGEMITPPEYMTPEEFESDLTGAGFEVLECRGFDYKPYQGYLFMSRWRPIIDPAFVQERLSRIIESKVAPRIPSINLLGYRIYVKCRKLR